MFVIALFRNILTFCIVILVKIYKFWMHIFSTEFECCKEKNLPIFLKQSENKVKNSRAILNCNLSLEKTIDIS